ncbi:MAG: hypothetical protein V3T17_11945 [Pseudomonadales bacterium]
MKIIQNTLLLGLMIFLSTPAIAVEYDCIVKKKFNSEHTYTKAELEKGKFSIQISAKGDNASLSRCSFAHSGEVVTCDKYEADKVIFDENVKIKKYYVFSSQFDVQVFSNLSFVENNGRGGISFGKCNVTSP